MDSDNDNQNRDLEMDQNDEGMTPEGDLVERVEEIDGGGNDDNDDDNESGSALEGELEDKPEEEAEDNLEDKSETDSDGDLEKESVEMSEGEQKNEPEDEPNDGLNSSLINESEEETISGAVDDLNDEPKDELKFAPVGSAEQQNGKNRYKILIVVLVVLMLVIIVGLEIWMTLFMQKEHVAPKTSEQETSVLDVKLKLDGNGLSDFDLAFLRMNNEQENVVYSPLSIKTALGMLAEGAEGSAKEQITNIIGDYTASKYINTQNMSFANAFFIRDQYREQIKDSYINTIGIKYGAEVIYDDFATPANINAWVSDKTMGLIGDLIDELDQNDFTVLVNALAIDMEWVNKIRSEEEVYRMKYAHEDMEIDTLFPYPGSRQPLEFSGMDKNINAIMIGATANRYDIISDLGEENIRTTITAEYDAWKRKGSANVCDDAVMDTGMFVNNYVKELGENYGKMAVSTDFYFSETDEVKVFAKDLREYDGKTLQYVGIMPKDQDVSDYVAKTKVKQISKLVDGLKPADMDSFEEGVVTKITGNIPTFKFDGELKLVENLKTIGITDVFDTNKASLTGITDIEGFMIRDAVHKAEIDFSNDGIKAAAATAMVGGLGASGCDRFEHLYEVPTEEIDLTFDKPYLFLVRDKKTGEVWFVGTVYQPEVFTLE